MIRASFELAALVAFGAMLAVWAGTLAPIGQF